MAIPHLVTNPVSRSSGGNAVHSAAYNTRSKMYDEQSRRVWDYSRKAEDVLWQGLFVPKDAPEWMQDRAKLWNEAERTETRINSRTARHVEMALPHELTPEQNRWLLQDFVRENFQRKGIVADVSIHRATRGGDERNVHAHVLLATREATREGFGEKRRDLDHKDTLQHWRDHWEKTVNRHLERHGHEQRIDMRSLADQGSDRTPGNHLGKHATAQERKGFDTDRGEDQRIVRRVNATRVIEREQHANDNGNPIDQAKADEQKKRQAALEQVRRDLEQTARKTETDRHLLTVLQDIIRTAARHIARAIGREAPTQQPRIEPHLAEPVVAERAQADRLREAARAASPQPVSRPPLVAQPQLRIEPMRPVAARPRPDPQPPPKKAKPDRPPSLMDIYKERAAKVRTTREEPRGRELRQELRPPARRRGLEDDFTR